MFTDKRFTNERAARLAKKMVNLPAGSKEELIAMMEEMLKKEEKKA